VQSSRGLKLTTQIHLVTKSIMVELNLHFTLRVTGFLDFVHRPEFHILENTTIKILDLFSSSGEEGIHLLSRVI
jgi:hypothetical protein